jgi:hypothetical protein
MLRWHSDYYQAISAATKEPKIEIQKLANKFGLISTRNFYYKDNFVIFELFSVCQAVGNS